MKYLVSVSYLVITLLLPTTSQAVQCAFLPFCLVTFSPPLDGVRIYENGIIVHDEHPYWAAAGNLRTSMVWCTDKPTATLKLCGYRGTQEFCGVTQAPAGVKVPPLCGTGPFPLTYMLKDLPTFGQLYAAAPGMCATNPACLALLADKCPIDTTGAAGQQVLFDHCVVDSTCADSLAKALPDVDQDGIKTAGDYYWWEYILTGAGKNQ